MMFKHSFHNILNRYIDEVNAIRSTNYHELSSFDRRISVLISDHSRFIDALPLIELEKATSELLHVMYRESDLNKKADHLKQIKKNYLEILESMRANSTHPVATD